ncbi:MAG: hypothetical protein EPN32_02535 [Rhodanobacter sp.]|nr:MAG: hypothetical protein EPN58_07205 [Rhodanobacter sp.]TAN28556.1 MAG: hypothetical protein EPN32_02535 [Rhodanobacter sp.]
MTSLTLYDKLWNSHRVADMTDGSSLLYIDLHLLHEVTSPQAFSNLRRAGRLPWRSRSGIATPDHNVPTAGRDLGLAGFIDPLARRQVAALEKNCADFSVPIFPLDDLRQGIVHVIGSEQGLTLPGMTVACGDSHTTTNGALAILALSAGSSEVEHVLATQTLRTRKLKNMAVEVDGLFAPGVGAKDLALHLIGRIGTAGGIGHAIEFRGTTVDAMSMEARMTLCNMSIEAGARIGVIGYDALTEAYVHGRPFVPTSKMWELANARTEDLRVAAGVVRGRHVHSRIKQALVIPGSGLVKLQAEREGLDEVFLNAGFEWREPGCSMCLGMNPDRLQPGERCASTTNRSFEGRQGRGGRTHLMSPAMAAAAAIAGALVDARGV